MLTKCLLSRVDYTCSGQATHGQALRRVKIRPKNLSHSHDGPPTNFTEPNTESQMV